MGNLERLNIVCEEINEKLVSKNVSAEVILIGGVLGKCLIDNFRYSFDIDFMLKEVSNYQTFDDIIDDFGIDLVTVVEVPPIEEMEFKETLEFSNFKVHIPTIEYFAITKLFSDRTKDESDLLGQEILKHCDMKKLDKMVELYKGDINNPDNMNYNFHNFESYKKDISK